MDHDERHYQIEKNVERLIEELLGNDLTGRPGFIKETKDRLGNIEDRQKEYLEAPTVATLNKIVTIMSSWKFVAGLATTFWLTLGGFIVMISKIIDISKNFFNSQ